MIGRDGKPVMEEVEVTKATFRPATVFDISQTDGKELPSLGVNELIGTVDGYEQFFEALRKSSPVPITFEKIDGSAKGYFHTDMQQIVIQKDMSEIQNVKTAIHEITHATLHNHNARVEHNLPEAAKKDGHTKEVEAESVAYAVCQHYGIDTSEYSFAYIAGWSSGKDTIELKNSMQLIRNTASDLIDKIDMNLDSLTVKRDSPEQSDRVEQILHPEHFQMGTVEAPAAARAEKNLPRYCAVVPESLPGQLTAKQESFADLAAKAAAGEAVSLLALAKAAKLVPPARSAAKTAGPAEVLRAVRSRMSEPERS